jgi:hypothetical protein
LRGEGEPAGVGLRQELLHPRELSPRHERPEIQIGGRGPGAQAGEAGGEPLDHLGMDPALHQHAAPAEQVWPAFCTIADTSIGSAASRSASAKTSCGDLPPSSSVTGHVVRRGCPRDPTRRSRSSP